ncbi:MAG: hypothetical protein ACI4RD_00090 [Kiritimatiellia bacterium]
MKTVCLPAALMLVLVSGCWTIRETEHPAVAVAALPEGKSVGVQLAGFEATVTSYDVVYGYTTVTGYNGPWHYGRHGWHGGGFSSATYATATCVPQVLSTAAYRDRASDALERAGCILRTTKPDYRVEVRFEGPFSDAGDGWATFGWVVCTLFTADYSGQTWRAQLRIHDLQTGKLVLSRTLAQRDEAVVWGPIPLFSPGASERTTDGVQKHLCLTALTDLAVAEAMQFFAGAQ